MKKTLIVCLGMGCLLAGHIPTAYGQKRSELIVITSYSIHYTKLYEITASDFLRSVMSLKTITTRSICFCSPTARPIEIQAGIA